MNAAFLPTEMFKGQDTSPRKKIVYTFIPVMASFQKIDKIFMRNLTLKIYGVYMTVTALFSRNICTIKSVMIKTSNSGIGGVCYDQIFPFFIYRVQTIASPLKSINFFLIFFLFVMI